MGIEHKQVERGKKAFDMHHVSKEMHSIGDPQAGRGLSEFIVQGAVAGQSQMDVDAAILQFGKGMKHAQMVLDRDESSDHAKQEACRWQTELSAAFDLFRRERTKPFGVDAVRNHLNPVSCDTDHIGHPVPRESATAVSWSAFDQR